MSVKASADATSDSAWRTSNLPFRVLGVTSTGSSVWACGSEESIASSSDGGLHWQIRHKATDIGLLLNIQFANDRFGYAAGTGGLLLTTDDAGLTWIPHPGTGETILQVSFSDPLHGLIRTSTSLLVTTDGGTTWAPVKAEITELKRFPYTFSLVALDSSHMGVMLKSGAAQYEPQTFLITEDAGKTWQFTNIPNVTLYNFLRIGDEYWSIGTEVVHKDRPGGGYAVPVALSSKDGKQWNHSNSDLSSCKPEMCVACTAQGCLSSNGTVSSFFSDTTYVTFQPKENLTPKWAATDSSICFLGDQLECTNLKTGTKPQSGNGPLPVAISPGPLGDNGASQGPRCIVCRLDTMLINKKAEGIFKINLLLTVAKNGMVTEAEAAGAPTPEIKARIEQQSRQWIFEPYVKDGVRVVVRLRTNVNVAVMKPH